MGKVGGTMYQKTTGYVHIAFLSLATTLGFVFIFTAAVRAQQTGGDLGGGAGIFRPKNPETRHSATNPSKPAARSARLSPAEVEAKFEDALADANDARDARKFAAAEVSYRAALRLKPRDGRAYYGLGNIFVDQQRWDDAEKSYRQAVDLAPNNPEALMALSFVLVQPRTGAVNAKRFTEAEFFARRATQLQPNSAVAFDRLGVAMIARGIFNKDTEDVLRRSVELDPNFVVAQVHLADVLRHTNRWNEASSLYKSAIDRANDAPTLVLIADALQSAERWDDSDRVLHRALQLDPRNPGALFLTGRLLALFKKYGEAEPFLKTAVEVNPKSFPVRNLLGRTYLGLNRYDDAFRTYEQAVDLASEADRKQLAGAFGFGGVGDGYMTAGRARDALRAYQRALQLDPSNSELQTRTAAARARLSP